MKKSSTIIMIAIFFGFLSCGENNHLDTTKSFQDFTGPYFGQTPPGDKAELFGKGIISTPLYTRDLTMMPDGNEVYFCVSVFGYNLIYFTKQIDGNWTEPKPTSFISEFSNMYYEPHITFDGSKMFFLSDIVDDDSLTGDQDIWVVDRLEDDWGKPYNLGSPINTDGAEFFPSTTKDGTLYFTRAANGTRIHFIYRSKLVNGKYTEPEKLVPKVNCGTNRFNAFIEKDEKYIIVSAVGMKDSYGGTDYYIVFRDKNDNWSKPINLGEKINTEGSREYSTSISPDGKYLFFMSSRGNPEINFNEKIPSFSETLSAFISPQNGNSDIYWIGTKFIEKLKKQAME